MRRAILFAVVMGALSVSWHSCARAASLQISEFLAVNNGTLRDEDGDASDWIEIHNSGTEVEFLDGWFLTDDAGDLTRWQFPAGIEMPPNSYRIIFASDKDRTNATGRLHTNFKLSSEGEYLALVDPLTNVVSEFAPEFLEQSEDVSYGRDPGDPLLLLHYANPTPGARNTTGGAGFAPEVVFSRNSGTFRVDQPFDLTLNVPLSNAIIYYALGTNVPGPNTNSWRYVFPVPINNSVIVRARAFANGLLPGPITSQSYIALASDVANFNSDLALMIVHNFGQGNVTETNQPVTVQTFELGSGGRSFLSDAPAQTERARFHLRGNSSAGLPKQPFFLEVQDELGADKESELLDLPEESDWVLYGPLRSDPSMMHNPLAYQLTRDFGRYAPRTRFVELFLKDNANTSGPITANDYNGVYVLTEKIKRDNNRVAIHSLEPEHLTSPEITGGYLFARDRQEPPFQLGGSYAYWVSPRYSEMTNVVRRPQLDYISNYFSSFANALASPQWTNGGYEAYIDTDSWIDYHIHQVVTKNTDSLRISTHFHKPRQGKITFGPPWDFDASQGSSLYEGFDPRVWASASSFFKDVPWWPRLFADPNFWQKWIDRYQMLREGPLSTNSIFAHVDRFADQLREAQLRDAARWGPSVRTGIVGSVSFSHDFGNTASFDAEIGFQKLWYTNRFAFLDTNFLKRPILNHPGGLVEEGFSLTVTPAEKPGTILLYTLDGTDPRLSGGGVSPLARSNVGPLTLTISSNVWLAARSYNLSHSNSTGGMGPPLSSHWSGLTSTSFFFNIPSLRVTELMYHPSPGGETNAEDFEYIEVANVGSEVLSLGGFKLRGGVEFDFPNLSLEAGRAAVVVANESRFVERYGSNALVLGTYEGRLENSGERLVLLGPCNEPILDFGYEDNWYQVTDGLGFSLVVAEVHAPREEWGFKSRWQPSGTLNGLPGVIQSPGVLFPPVVVNEVLSHAVLPVPFDTVELYNLSDAVVSVGGWFLTDDLRVPKKFRIPADTSITQRGFLLLDERQFNFGNSNGSPFSLNSLGDEVYLFSANTNGDLTGYVHGFAFGPQEAGVTVGRQLTTTGEEHFVPQVQRTLASGNAGPKVGPVVISEVMYHPSDFWQGTNLFDNTGDEFIELQNVSSLPVVLADPSFPNNTWRLENAIQYQFPPNAAIPAGGLILVVKFNPSDTTAAQRFRQRFNVPAAVAIFGPYSGKLDNSTDAVELQKPGEPRPSGPPDFGLVPYILAERVQYSGDLPWPMAADGDGASLHRVGSYADDPANWVAAVPSPGRNYVGGGAPTIVVQPTDTTAVEYATAHLRVEAAGTGNLIYQWKFKSINIPRATNASLLLSNLQSSHAGPYEVTITDAIGSIRSRTASLNVLDGVKILSQPASQRIPAGSNVTLTVAATSSTPIRYQWQFNATNLTGQVGSNLTLSSITNIHEGVYTVLVSDEISSRLSDPAILTVLLRPRMIEPFPPLMITATSNQFVTLGAQTIGTVPMMYRWRRISPIGAGTVLDTFYETGRIHFATLPLSTLTNGTYVYTLILSNAVQTNLNIAQTNAFVTVVSDNDNDGLPDDYELAHQLRPDLPGDAGHDADGDGVTNLKEFLASTDPGDPLSFLRIDSISANPGALIQFGAVANKTYTLEYSDGSFGPFWSKLTDILPRPTNRIEIIRDSSVTTNRFYRLATPRRP